MDVQQAIGILKTGNSQEKLDALEAFIGRYKEPGVYQAIVDALSDSDDDVKIKAINLISLSENFEGVVHVVALLEDENKEVSDRAKIFISTNGSKKAVKPLLKLLSKNKETCLQSLITLGGLSFRIKLNKDEVGEIIESIIKLFNHKDFEIREAAVNVLTRFFSLEKFPEKQKKQLQALLTSKKFTERECAALTFCYYRDETAVSVLLELMKDPAANVKVDVLGLFSVLKSVEKVKDALKKSLSEFPERLEQALAGVDEHQKGIEELKALAEDIKKDVKDIKKESKNMEKYFPGL